MNADYSFLTIEMVLSTNLVPSKYAGQDVQLQFSPENPAHLGYWLASPGGHQRIALKALIEHIGGKPCQIGDPLNKEIAELIKAMPIAYCQE
jgi:hypothetical protein